MKILVIGSGGREHALAWKLAAVAARQRSAGRAGQRRHRARAAASATSTSPRTDLDGLLSSRRREDVALTVVGPGSAARCRRRRPLPRRRPPLLRPAPDRRAARRLQGLRQGLPGAPQHSDRGATRCSANSIRRWPTCANSPRQSRQADRDQGRRPGGRQGRRHRADRWPMPSRRCTTCSARDVARQRRGARRDRGIPRRRRGQLHRDRATATNALPLATSQDHKRVATTAISARTPAAWARTRRRRS